MPSEQRKLSSKERRIYAVLIGVSKGWATDTNAEFLQRQYPTIEPMTMQEAVVLLERLTTINID